MNFSSQSGWQDSNLRPPAPKAGAITGLRYTPKKSGTLFDNNEKFLTPQIFQSGWQDSNLRPPAPKAGAITGLRYTPKKSGTLFDKKREVFNSSENFRSGWQDSNLRPPAPKAGAITGLRYTPKISGERGIRTPGTDYSVRQFSKLVVSATHPPLLIAEAKVCKNF